MSYVIDCITATRSTSAATGESRQRIEFAVWLNLAGLTAPVTARLSPVRVDDAGVKPLTPPILIGPITGSGSHHHSGDITDIEPGTHHRLTVRVQDGDGREYSGSVDLVRDDFEVMVANLGRRGDAE